MEHINGCTIDQSWIHTNSVSEGDANWTHTYDHVKIGLHSVEHKVVYRLVVLFYTVLFRFFEQIVLNLFDFDIKHTM